MDDREWLASQFEEQRPRLRSVAYRMLGSLADADDAVQDTWLRLSRTDPSEVDNMAGWLTTITTRVCLNVLRSRTVRREDSLEYYVPDPLVHPEVDSDPAAEATLADSVSLALLVVLETLNPAERLAFVLHDLFGLPFDEIAPMIEKTPAATRQLTSRARRQVKGAELPARDTDRRRQRRAVDAFFAAARNGDFEALVSVLHPDVVLRIDNGAAVPGASMMIRGADSVAKQSGSGMRSLLSRADVVVHPAIINGAEGVIVTMRDRPVAVMGFSFTDGRITEIDSVSDPGRVERITAPTH